MRARTLADAEQGGRHRIDSVLAAWIRYRRYAAWRASWARTVKAIALVLMSSSGSPRKLAVAGGW